jgi:hypothetical protein
MLNCEQPGATGADIVVNVLRHVHLTGLVYAVE